MVRTLAAVPSPAVTTRTLKSVRRSRSRVGVEAAETGAQGAVEGVDRAIALGNGQEFLVADAQAQGRLGDRFGVARAFLDENAEGQQFKEFAIAGPSLF